MRRRRARRGGSRPTLARPARECHPIDETKAQITQHETPRGGPSIRHTTAPQPAFSPFKFFLAH